MSTERQRTANKLNAQKSTGPTSTAGKAKSCLNHLSHGFASSTARLIEGEDPEEFRALLADLLGQYQPANPTEQILVERMAQNEWLSQRAFRLQTQAFSSGLFRMTSRLQISKDLGVLIRYRTSAENAFHKAHNELLKAQKERKKSEIGFESQETGEAADCPSAKRKNDPITVEVTGVWPDFRDESASSVAPEAQLVAEFIKTAA